MKIYLKSLLFFLSLFLLPGCWNKDTEPSETDLLSGLIVVNVLDNALYKDSHIKGSINVPFEQIEEKAKSFDKNAEIVLYCANYMCTSSDYAGKKLKKLGFEHVAVYHGGTAEWYQKGLPTQGPCKNAYLTKQISGEHIEQDDAAIPSIDVYTLAQKMGFGDVAA